MNVFRTMFGMQTPNGVRAWSARILALVVAVWGMKSLSEMALGSKLMLTYSLDMWDFNESDAGFLLELWVDRWSVRSGHPLQPVFAEMDRSQSVGGHIRRTE